MNAVNAKSYTRNDRNNEARVGFIAQDLQEACTGNFAHIVGKATQSDKDSDGNDIPETEQELLTLDYSRLCVVLWGALQHTNKRVAELEHTVLRMQQIAS